MNVIRFFFSFCISEKRFLWNLSFLFKVVCYAFSPTYCIKILFMCLFTLQSSVSAFLWCSMRAFESGRYNDKRRAGVSEGTLQMLAERQQQSRESERNRQKSKHWKLIRYNQLHQNNNTQAFLILWIEKLILMQTRDILVACAMSESTTLYFSFLSLSYLLTLTKAFTAFSLILRSQLMHVKDSVIVFNFSFLHSLKISRANANHSEERIKQKC